MIDIIEPSIFDSKRRKAVKQHRCCECLGKIDVGEKYLNIGGLWDGDWGHYKLCEDCETLRDKINAESDRENRIAFGYLDDAMLDLQDDVPELLAEYLEIKRKRGIK